ncbi:MAG TPA: type II secretion system protein [Candidatus Acidoferrales bacterium]|jgi:type II secretory pathway pseudopilin PulG|nr:type II secretion system protein [Candidatus Acidoferrales bacterium]
MTTAVPITERRREAGFTLLMVVFLVAIMSITALAVAPNLLTEGRREKEADMIWRGEQYQRAILLYYRKFGKYPTKIEDLTKQTNGVRFLRQAYTDPMNKDDGSWRFIYVGPNGQLIGSLRPTTLLQNALSPQGTAGLSLLTGGAQSILGAPGAVGANSTQTPGAAANGQQQSGAGTANPLESQPQPLTGAVLGGNIIGVGSKIKKPSLKVYMGGDTYEQWEFIANTTGLQTVLPTQAPVNPNANPNGAPTGADPNAPPVIPPPTSPAPVSQ